MKTRQLGHSDLFVTPVGFGAWAIGGSGWEFGWGEQDDTRARFTLQIKRSRRSKEKISTRRSWSRQRDGRNATSFFVSSESAINVPVEMIHYGVTKTMQGALARGLAETTAGTAVTVNSVLAGPTCSDGVEKFIEDMARTKNVATAEIENEFFRTAAQLLIATFRYDR